MRVLPSLPRGAIGLTLLALLASGPLAQGKRGQTLSRADRQNVLPSESLTKSVLRRTHFEWSELQQFDASLPENAFPIEEALKALANQPRSTEGVVVEEFEVDPSMIKQGRSHVRPIHDETPRTPGGIERLGPCTGFPVAPAASLSTAGQGDGMDGFGTFFYPPNAAGSVGPDHLMVMAPNITLIQDRLGASLAAVNTITFWSPTGAASVTHCRLYYDLLSDRWLASALGGAGIGGTSILFACSDSDNPLGGWDFYSWNPDPTNTTFADHPKMGFGPDHIVFTTDHFLGVANGQNRGTVIGILEKAAVLAATAPTLTQTGLDTWGTASGFGGAFVNWRLQPSRALDTSVSEVWLWNVRLTSGTTDIVPEAGFVGGTGAAPTITIVGTYLNDIPYTNVRLAINQLAPEVRGIDPLAPDGQQASNRARIDDAVIRNGSLFMVSRTGQPGANNAAATRNNVNFYEVDTTASPFLTPFVQAVAITTGASTHLAFPSIAVNCAEDVLIGMTSSDSSKYLEAATCMRLGSDPLNTMGAVTTLKAGVDNWWQDAPAPQGNAGVAFTLPGLGAWGHYTTSSVDPNDQETLWTLQPYAEARVGGADADSRWGTWWGRFGDCEVLPVITDQPDSVSGCIGDPATFQVTAVAGPSPITYQWQLDGNDIPGATTDTLNIPVTVGADEGTYVCLIGPCGIVFSDPAVLDFGAPVINVQPVGVLVGLGQPASLSITATPSLGLIHYQWFHEATPVGTDSSTYSVAAVTSADYGFYTCVVSDDCGPLSSDQVFIGPFLKGNHKLPGAHTDILIEPSTQLGCVGDSASFKVLAAPQGSTYQWRKDGVDLPLETSDTLNLSGLTFGSAGLYDCIVDIGTDVLESHDAVLDMGDNPVITDHPDDKTVSGSVMVIFSVTATGHAPLHYQWRYSPPSAGNNFTDIPGANSNVLVIEQSYSFTAGRYRCAVSNPCGTTLSDIARLIIL